MLKKLLNKLFWGLFRHLLNDKQYALYRYWLEFDRKLNLDDPQQFSEKIQHIKLYERTKLRKLAADRIGVRTFVEEKIGGEHLIPLIGNYRELTKKIWNSFPQQFVIKANHGCKMLRIVENKQSESFEEVQQEAKQWQDFDYYSFGREWIYKDLPRTIVTEELILNSEGDIPKDYKFFCFHGKVELIQVDFGRFEGHTRNFYDREFNLLPITYFHEQFKGDVIKPTHFNRAIEIAEILSEDFNFIRVDLFLLREGIYFGELTNFPSNGFPHFSPENTDLELGRKLHLSID